MLSSIAQHDAEDREGLERSTRDEEACARLPLMLFWTRAGVSGYRHVPTPERRVKISTQWCRVCSMFDDVFVSKSSVAVCVLTDAGFFFV